MQTPSESRRAMPTTRSPSRAKATCCDCRNEACRAAGERPLSKESAARSAFACSQSMPSSELSICTATAAASHTPLAARPPHEARTRCKEGVLSSGGGFGAATVPRSLRCGGPFQAPVLRSGHLLHGPLHPHLPACALPAPRARGERRRGQRSARFRPSRTRPGRQVQCRCGPFRRPNAQGADARPAGRADRGPRARRSVSLRRQLAEWVRLLRSRRLRLCEARDPAAAQRRRAVLLRAGYRPRQPEPGDLVFFHGLGHVGLYIGRGRIIHAPQSGERVSIQSLASRSGSVEGARRLVRS